MRPGRRRLLSPVLALLALSAGAVQAQPYKLSVNYEGPPAVAREIERAFEAFRGDVLSFVSLPAGTPADVDRLAATADIVWGGGDSLYRKLLSDGRVQPYASSELASLDGRYPAIDPSIPVSGVEATVIAYVPGPAAPASLPARWRDLLEPRWKGLLILRRPSSDADAPAATAIARSLDWSFLEALAAQRPLAAASDDEALSRLAAGEALAAIVPYHAVTQARTPLEVIWPSDALVTAPRPIAILKQDRRPAMLTGMAEQLIDYVMSADGQAIGRRHGLFPTRLGTPPPQGAAPLAAGAEAGWLRPQPADLRERLARLFGGR